MTPEQKQAHERLLSSLPVRTHFVPLETPTTKGGGRVRTNAQCAEIRKRIESVQLKGWKVRRIAEHLEMSRTMVYNYLRKRWKG